VGRLSDAEARYARGDRIESVRRRLEEARDALAEAERLLPAGRDLFAEALAARTAALETDAPGRVPELWEAAEREIRETGRRLERGDLDDVEARLPGVTRLFREAELEAIRSDVLGRALSARAEAMQVGARELAAETFGRAERTMEEANRVLEGDRTLLAEAADLAEAAAGAYLRAARIGSLSDSVARRRLPLEQVMRRHERELAGVTAQLGFDPDYSRGTEPVVERAVAAISSLQEDRRNLQGELARSESESRELRSRVDSLEVRLAGAERREAEISAELRERQRRERRLREIGAIFTEEEGEVLVSGNELVLRLHGFTFDSGSDEIKPEHFALLTKVQRVLREFPDAPVRIEGHTDSQGNDAFNRTLSRRRAVAVREYLLASMPISADRLSAVGYGEDRPVASNETAVGRERNRRIDIVLDLSEG